MLSADKIQRFLDLSRDYAQKYHTADCFSKYTKTEVVKGSALLMCGMDEIMGADDAKVKFDTATIGNIHTALGISNVESQRVVEVADIFTNMLMNRKEVAG